MANRYRIGPAGHRVEVDVEDLKSSIVLSELVSWHTPLRRSGGAWKGLCPFHEERTASFVVDDRKGLYYCHGCRRGGDVIDFVKATTNCEFVHALEWLVQHKPVATFPVVDRAAEHHRSRTVRAILQDEARAIWRASRPIAGTLAERYLASRGLAGNIPGTLRYGTPPVWIDAVTGRRGPSRPAMIAACQDVDGKIIGIQRTFLSPDGGKAAMESPRLSLGQIRGGALRLGPEASEIMLCEATEDGLTLSRMFPGRTVWVALGTGNMPHVALPPIVQRIILAGDADDAGRAAVNAAGEALQARRFEVKTIFPHGAKDFNEEWQIQHE